MTHVEYPDSWEADVVLLDGRTAHLRPIRPTDKDRLVDFYARVSDESKYYRFFTPTPHLSDSVVDWFVGVDHDRRVALVVTIGDQIVGMASYESLGNGEAEVAFLVQDDQQGRGIGQLLLEHLAEAARERGLSRFVAEVLPANHRMRQVFRDQGYRVTADRSHGVVHLEFAIDPTDTAIGVVAAREHRAEAASIKAFLAPRSIAVIGASRKEDTIGAALVRNLVAGGYTGQVHVVNPAAATVADRPAWSNVTEIPDPVDVAIVAVPADVVGDVILDCAAKGVHGLIVISSGFAETGDEGRLRQRRLVGLARSYGMRLIGPNALGVMNTDPAVSMNASLAPLLPPHGRAGFFCQSGALGTAILEKVRWRGLGLSTFVSAGNRADVSGNDLLQYWDEDDATELVLLYLESIGNPRKFSRIARRVSRGKPVIAVRTGRFTQGVPVGHAVAALTAPPEAIDAMFEQAGIVQVDTLDELFDVAQILAHQPLPTGGRIAVIGNSDAIGLLAADAVVAAGLEVSRSDALGVTAAADDFAAGLTAALADPRVDAVLAIYVPPLDDEGGEVAAAIATAAHGSTKPVVSSFLGREGVPELLRVSGDGLTAGRGSVPSFGAVEQAARALAHVAWYADWRRRSAADADDELPDISADEARRIVATVLVDQPHGRTLTDAEAEALLACYGIAVQPRVIVTSQADAIAAGEQLGWDVVLKAVSEPLVYRPDLANVWRNIDNPEAMTQAWTALAELAGEVHGSVLVVQQTAPPGVPVRVAAYEDQFFGPTISFSISGAITELVGDQAWRIPPLSAAEAAATVRSIRAAPLLFGHRGSPEVDVAAAEDLLRRVAMLKHDHPQVSVVELGSVHVTPDGVVVLDTHIAVAPVGNPRSDLRVRRLNEPVTD